VQALLQLIFILLALSCFNSCAITRLLNSGTANIKYRASEAKIHGINYEEDDRVRSPSFSIRNVQHPRAWGKWNFNVRITPSLHIDNQTYTTGATYLSGETGRMETYPSVNVKRFITLANLKFTTHTPIGAFALSGGFGGTVYHMDNGAWIDTTKTREIRRIDFVWYGFLSKRFFVLMGPRYYKAGYETYEFAFRIGYFWGRIER
tara:strand:- start:5405 stop:6019 length:615 start_codon:yes stop_codon:yes gene_type:complete